MKPVPEIEDEKKEGKVSECENILKALLADNFVTYFKAHTMHFNVQGVTFSQDHSLLEEVYSFLYGQHDGLGEQLRMMDVAVPPSLVAMCKRSIIEEVDKTDMPSKEMFSTLAGDMDVLMSTAQELFEESEEYGHGGLNTFVGDYLRDLSKLKWKLKATLGKSIK